MESRIEPRSSVFQASLLSTKLCYPNKKLQVEKRKKRLKIWRELKYLINWKKKVEIDLSKNFLTQLFVYDIILFIAFGVRYHFKPFCKLASGLKFLAGEL